MAKIPEPEHSTRALIDKHHEGREDGPRYHLGASLLGHHCDRYLWLNFRWAVKESFPGRILRLFRRGQNEEAIVVDDLRAIGCDVSDGNGGKQWRVDFGKHVSGSMDGVVLSGLPEAPKTKHVLEIKTHSKKSFDDLEKHGVQKSKPMHWAQMQVYMDGTGCERALYAAVCKDDDRYYFERVYYDAEAAGKLIERGHRITMSERMPEPCAGASPDWYLCKFCPAYEFCHGDNTTRQVNCRTCAHYTATPESGNHCARWDSDIPKESLGGCDSHVLHPDLVPWVMVGGDEINAFYDIGGDIVTNGEGGVSSKELIAKC